MTYPPHLRHLEDRVAELWSSADLAAVFPGGQPKVTLPWPRARRLARGRLYDADRLHAEFAESTPAIALVDPRSLWASQPSILREGVEYYLGPTWFRTGTTFADQHRSFNRLPVIERRSDGTDVILGGHHRSCAALLRGEYVLARVVVHPDRDAPAERVDLRLPSLAVGPWSGATPSASVTEAVTSIRYGTRVTVAGGTEARLVVDALADAPNATA